MTSQAQALEPLPGVRGLVFLAFPLHPAGRVSTERASHLRDVSLPMLFLQGTKDALDEISLVREIVDGLGDRAKLVTFDQADHAFRCRPAPDARTLRSGTRCWTF